MSNSMTVGLLLLAVLALSTAVPVDRLLQYKNEGISGGAVGFAGNAADLQASASGHEHHGRVQIKVYRGPSKHDHHESHAPYGYWVKQPADDYHHH